MINTNNDKDRYERKFLVENTSLTCLKNIRFLLPLDLHEIYSDRLVNSIYYDTENLLLAKNSIEGNSSRFKIRLRYYGDINSFESPLLEIKYKNGEIGNKYKISLKKEDIINKNFNVNELLEKNMLPYQFVNILSFLRPKVFISYKRNYYITTSDKFRLTFDSNINFKIINRNKIIFGIRDYPQIRYSNKIIELKYLKENEIQANQIVKKLPFRLTSISKYNIALSHLSII